MDMQKAIFLDRDGTIIVDFGYMHKADQLEFIPKSIKALQLLRSLHYILIIITNQSGIGRGYYTIKDYSFFKKLLHDELAKNDVSIEAEFFCPHRPEEQCGCRKPNIVNFETAIRQFNIDPMKSFVIGDKTEDIKAANNIGAQSILVKTGKAGLDSQYNVQPNHIANNLYEASLWIQQNYQ
jgi:D-glycero-D-manno-heptose 1,7-bisphosphate phosphatase